MITPCTEAVWGGAASALELMLWMCAARWLAGNGGECALNISLEEEEQMTEMALQMIGELPGCV